MSKKYLKYIQVYIIGPPTTGSHCKKLLKTMEKKSFSAYAYPNSGRWCLDSFKSAYLIKVNSGDFNIWLFLSQSLNFYLCIKCYILLQSLF